jgi:signal transduction histidine kinase
LFGLASAIILYLFEDFRQDDFKNRLDAKATQKLQLWITEKDSNLVNLMDRNTLNQFYQERTAIINHLGQIVYRNPRNETNFPSLEDLEKVETKSLLFDKRNESEVFGKSMVQGGKRYSIFISAVDHFGIRKMEFLIYVLIATYVLFSLIALLLGSYLVRKELKPLDLFLHNLRKITEENLDLRLDSPYKGRHEIAVLVGEFNDMMERIERAYHQQKEFTSQLSHELRTPLARMATQFENQLQECDEKDKDFMKSALLNIDRLNELIQSLMLLTRIEYGKQNKLEMCQIDEVLFQTLEKIHQSYGNLMVQLDLDESIKLSDGFRVEGNTQLIEIALSNLLENACKYSEDQHIKVRMFMQQNILNLLISNNGKPLSKEDQKRLFQPFMRGENAAEMPGMGLGLRIVRRILNSFGHEVSYTSTNLLNNFTVRFKPAA